MSDLITALRPHPASLEKSLRPDSAHEPHDDDSNPTALERSSRPTETATHAGRSSFIYGGPLGKVVRGWTFA